MSIIYGMASDENHLNQVQRELTSLRARYAELLEEEARVLELPDRCSSEPYTICRLLDDLLCKVYAWCLAPEGSRSTLAFVPCLLLVLEGIGYRLFCIMGLTRAGHHRRR